MKRTYLYTGNTYTLFSMSKTCNFMTHVTETTLYTLPGSKTYLSKTVTNQCRNVLYTLPMFVNFRSLKNTLLALSVPCLSSVEIYPTNFWVTFVFHLDIADQICQALRF